MFKKTNLTKKTKAKRKEKKNRKKETSFGGNRNLDN